MCCVRSRGRSAGSRGQEPRSHTWLSTSRWGPSRRSIATEGKPRERAFQNEVSKSQCITEADRRTHLGLDGVPRVFQAGIVVCVVQHQALLQVLLGVVARLVGVDEEEDEEDELSQEDDQEHDEELQGDRGGESPLYSRQEGE